MTIPNFRHIVSVLILLWGICLSAQPIEILSSTPMGLPCGGVETPRVGGCMPDDQVGWMVMVRGSAPVYRATLTYRKPDGEKATATGIVESSGLGIDAIVFRVGPFRDGGNRFASLEVLALKEGAKLRQEAMANGTIITIGETTWGPPQALSRKMLFRAERCLNACGQPAVAWPVAYYGWRASTNLKESK